MTNQDALKTLEEMPEPEFQQFFTSLPYRVQLACKGDLVDWRETLPQWYINKKDLEMKSCCNNPQIKDLTQNQGDERHYYCMNCKSHVWKNQFYTKTEWDKWIKEGD